MKVCPQCNMQLADDAVFCNGCGQMVNAAPAAPVYQAPAAPVYQAPVAPAAPVYEAPAAPAEEKKEPFLVLLFGLLSKAMIALCTFCSGLAIALCRPRSYYLRFDEASSVFALLFSLGAMGCCVFNLIFGIIQKRGMKVMFQNIAAAFASFLLFIFSIVLCSNC